MQNGESPQNECKITKKEEIKRYLNEKDSKLRNI